MEREAQSRDLLEMLGGLWAALDIAEDAPERGMVHKLLGGDRPQRLHKRTLDKVCARVWECMWGCRWGCGWVLNSTRKTESKDTVRV